jgi:hypothetical protein
MAVCPDCHGEMLDNISCRPDAHVRGGIVFEPIRWGDEKRRHPWPAKGPCGDCGTPPGGVHHLGCDVDQCPLCYGQSFLCGCWFDDEDEEEEEWDDAEPHSQPSARRCTSHPYCHTHRRR